MWQGFKLILFVSSTWFCSLTHFLSSHDLTLFSAPSCPFFVPCLILHDHSISCPGAHFLALFSLFPESCVCHKDSLSTNCHIHSFSQVVLLCLFPFLTASLSCALHCPPHSHDLTPSLTKSFSLSLLSAHSLSCTCLLSLEQSPFCTPSLPHSPSLCYSQDFSPSF